MSVVSITELHLKSILYFPRFAFHAIRTKSQSESANGNLVTKTTGRGLYLQYTMTLWKSRKDMIDYKKSGAHREAVRIFPKIATGRIFSFESNELPDWGEAFKLLQEKGRQI